MIADSSEVLASVNHEHSLLNPFHTSVWLRRPFMTMKNTHENIFLFLFIFLFSLKQEWVRLTSILVGQSLDPENKDTSH